MKKLIAILLLVSSPLAFTQELHTFSNGEVADADDINSNFETLKDQIDQIGKIFGVSCPDGTFVVGISLSKTLLCSRDTGSTSIDLAYSDSYGAIDLSAAGDVLAISHFSDGSTVNAVMAFDRQSASQWTQRGDTVYVDLYGQEISISGSGDTVSVGDPIAGSRRGKAFVWHWQDNEWTQRGSSFIGAASSDLMRDPDLNYAGDVFAIDEFQFGDRQGRVRTFIWDGSEWLLEFSNTGGAGERIQFPTLNSNGDIMAYGSSLTTGSDPAAGGVVRVFEKVDTDWIQKGNEIRLANENRAIKPVLNSAGDKVLLLSVDLTSDTSVCQAHVAEWNAFLDGWSVSDAIRFGAGSGFASCRGRLSGDGTTIILGNAETPSGDHINAGIVYVLRRSGSQWVNILEYSGTAENERLGVRVAISDDGNTIAYSRLGSIEVVSL